MKLIELWRKKIETDFSRKGLLARLVLDLFLSNLGFFLGILTTVFFKGFTWDTTPQSFFSGMVINVWLANTPLLIFCCLFSYLANGLYRSMQNITYFNITLFVVRAVGLAFFLFLLLIFMTETFMPRSTMVATLVFIFLFILSTRLLWKYLIRNYNITSTVSYNKYIEKIAREQALLSQQDGWVPPENLPVKSAWPYFEDDEIIAATSVLRSGKINQWTGKEVEYFQEEFAAACVVRHAVALANGSVALELALKVCEIGSGDEVIVTPRTFIASASSIVLQGAIPVFADIDRQSQNITVESIKTALSPRSKAIIAVHLAGWPCEMDKIMKFAAEHNLFVIEDCAQAHGAMFKNRSVGSFGQVAAFSFCQDKIMTTGGEGGMLLTNDEKIWAKAWSFKDHGKSYDAVYRREHPPGFRWLHESFGTNWRMTEMQAAIGRQQLKKLKNWVKLRREHADLLTERFAKMTALRIVRPTAEFFHSYYKYYVFVRPERLKKGWNRDRIMNEIVSRGVPCFSGSCSEIYREKAFVENALQPSERLPVARELGDTSLMFLVHPTLNKEDMTRAANITEMVMAKASI